MADELQLSSPAFDDDNELPARHTGDGEDRSPPLQWTDPPAGTKELVLVCDDRDNDTGVFVHWVVYGIEPDVRELPEGLAHNTVLTDPVDLLQGLNDLGQSGWSGPLPDDERGPHRLFFRLEALDVELDLPPGATREELREACKGHVLASAELVGIG